MNGNATENNQSDRALVRWDGNGTLTAGPFILSRTGLSTDASPAFEEWEAAGRFLSQVEGSIHWWIGDWLNYGERTYGEKYSQALQEELGFSYQTLQDDAWVARRVNFSSREEKLTFKHHKAVAPLEPLQQRRFLDMALENGWSCGELRQQVKALRAREALEKASLPEGRYSLILADPPWQYDFSETESREIENQYPTMTVEEISALAVPAADDCVLLLWATAPKLEEALAVMEAWGFEYKTHAVWDKEKIGMGYWFRGQHELLLVGTRGHVYSPSASESSVIRELRTQHSRKPEAIYALIERMFPGYGEKERVELFARSKRSGWSSWGTDV